MSQFSNDSNDGKTIATPLTTFDGAKAKNGGGLAVKRIGFTGIVRAEFNPVRGQDDGATFEPYGLRAEIYGSTR